MANIFINYRRADSITVAFIIYNRLLEKKHTVFIDKEAIPVGFDFASFIEKKIKAYDVMLTLIGNQWMDIRGTDKKLRIRNQHDHVRLELAEALQSNTIKVIPVLIDKVQLPEEKSLPKDLKKLVKLNAVDFLSYEYNKSADRVMAAIEHSLNLLKSKDLSPFIKIMNLKDDRGLVYTLRAAMEANLLTAGITANINFEDLDDNTVFVSKLKKGQGTFMLSVLYAAEQFGVKFTSWKTKRKTGIKKKTEGRLKRYTVNSIDEIITHLNANRPVIAVANIYLEPWYGEKATADGLIADGPKPDAKLMGSQALLISQVDLVKDRIKFAIMWGDYWGNKGIGYFTEESFFKYIEKDQMYAIETVY